DLHRSEVVLVHQHRQRRAALDEGEAAAAAGFAYGGRAAAVLAGQHRTRQHQKGAQQQGQAWSCGHVTLAMAATPPACPGGMASVDTRAPAQEPGARGSSKRAGSRRGASRCTTTSATR